MHAIAHRTTPTIRTTRYISGFQLHQRGYWTRLALLIPLFFASTFAADKSKAAENDLAKLAEWVLGESGKIQIVADVAKFLKLGNAKLTLPAQHDDSGDVFRALAVAANGGRERIIVIHHDKKGENVLWSCNRKGEIMLTMSGKTGSALPTTDYVGLFEKERIFWLERMPPVKLEFSVNAPVPELNGGPMPMMGPIYDLSGQQIGAAGIIEIPEPIGKVTTTHGGKKKVVQLNAFRTERDEQDVSKSKLVVLNSKAAMEAFLVLPGAKSFSGIFDGRHSDANITLFPTADSRCVIAKGKFEWAMTDLWAKDKKTRNVQMEDRNFNLGATVMFSDPNTAFQIAPGFAAKGKGVHFVKKSTDHPNGIEPLDGTVIIPLPIAGDKSKEPDAKEAGK